MNWTRDQWKALVFGIGLLIVLVQFGLWPAVAVGCIAWSVKS